MPVVIALKFAEHEMPLYYLPGPLSREELKTNNFCVALREEEEEVGYIAGIEHRAKIQIERDPPFPAIVRRATESEVTQWWENKLLERRAMQTCKEKVIEHNLPMKVSTVRYLPKMNKLAFQFTSDKRVDFRLLVRDLASILRCRIELWQIGVREEARLIDGFGVCGLQTCCATWIKDFNPINLKMAKDQDIDLPPSKLTGQCGRLLCCLAYEVECYRELSRESLPRGATITHAGGRGVIVDRNLLQNSYLVSDEAGAISVVPASSIREYSLPPQMKQMGKKLGSESRRSLRGRPEAVPREEKENIIAPDFEDDKNKTVAYIASTDSTSREPEPPEDDDDMESVAESALILPDSEEDNGETDSQSGKPGNGGREGRRNASRSHRRRRGGRPRPRPRENGDTNSQS